MLRDNVGESYDVDLSILKVLSTFSHSIIDILARNVFTHPWFGTESVDITRDNFVPANVIGALVDSVYCKRHSPVIR